MGNVLEFYLKLKDMMSSGLAKMAAVGKNSFAQIEGHVKRVQGSINSTKKNTDMLSASFSALKDKAAALDKAISLSRSKSEIAGMRRELSLLNNEIKNHAGNTDRGNGMAGGLIRRLAPAAFGAGLLAFVASSANAGMEFEAQQKTYQVMAGKTRGTQLSNELRDLKQNTIMGSAVYGNAQTMMGFGINDKEVIGNLKMLGDVAMGDADKLGRLTLAFSQTQSAGKLMGQDLLQYINAGFNPLYYISLKTGKSIGALREEMEKGAISSAMVTEAFQMATGEGGRFNGMMEQMAETTFGKVKMMQGQWAAFKISVGNALSPVVSLLASMATGLLKSKPALVMFGIGLIGLIASLSMTAMATTKVTTALTALKTAMLTNPATVWIAGISALVLVIATLIGKLDSANSAAAKLDKKFAEIAAKAPKEAEETAASIAGEKISSVEQIIRRLKSPNINDDIKKADAATLKNMYPDFFSKISAKDNFAGLDAAFKTFESSVKIHEAAVSASEQLKKLKGELDVNIKKAISETHKKAKEGGYGEMVEIYSMSEKAKVPVYKTLTGAAMEAARQQDETSIINKMTESFEAANADLYKDINKDDNSLLAIRAAKSNSTVSSTNVGENNVSRSVVSGGPRVININGVTLKFADRIDIAAKDPEDLINKAETEIKGMWLRVLNSGAKVQI